MAAEKQQVYVCNVCGNTVEVVQGGAGTLVCCGVPMQQLKENTTDATEEKHVPVVENVDGGVRVRVGSVLHPTQDDHYIQWIEVIADGKCYRQFLSPGDEPAAVFPIESERVAARAICNLHGLWRTG